jgi:hypothetical protein
MKPAMALLLWLLFGLIAFAMGALRELALRPLVGDHWAHAMGTLAVLVLYLFLIDQYLKRTRQMWTTRDLILLGLFWFIATIAFEFGFFHLVFRKPWSVLLADYNLAAGRLWALVPLALLAGPVALRRFRRSWPEAKLYPEKLINKFLIFII